MGDPFFYDSIFSPGGKEAAGPTPPWGVVTMFTAFAELEYDYLVENESQSLQVHFLVVQIFLFSLELVA